MKKGTWCLCKTGCIHHVKMHRDIKKVCVKGAGCPGVHCAFCQEAVEMCWSHEVREGEVDNEEWLINI